jgi:hypothetical protein
MKKLLITCLALIAFVLPSLAQVDHNSSTEVVLPNKSIDLIKDQISLSVLDAAKVNFNMDNPLSWTRFPYSLHEIGWVYDKDASGVNPDHYEFTIKSQKGSDFHAEYSADGNLISTREMVVNMPVPPSVQESLSKSKYKDWKVTGTKQITKYFHKKNSVEQNFRLTVENDNVKRSISFNYKGHRI